MKNCEHQACAECLSHLELLALRWKALALSHRKRAQKQESMYGKNSDIYVSESTAAIYLEMLATELLEHIKKLSEK